MEEAGGDEEVQRVVHEEYPVNLADQSEEQDTGAPGHNLSKPPASKRHRVDPSYVGSDSTLVEDVLQDTCDVYGDEQSRNGLEDDTRRHGLTLSSFLFNASFNGDEADPFREQMVQGAVSMKRRTEISMKHGLALWARALKSVIAKEETSTSQDDASSGENTLTLDDEQRQNLTAGLDYIESLSFGTARDQPRLSFAYIPDSSLTIGDYEFFPLITSMLCAVPSRDEPSKPGAQVIRLLQQLIRLGQHAREAKSQNPDRPGSNLKFTSSKISAFQMPPHLGPVYIGKIRYIPAPPATHAARQARMFAVLSAVGHFAHKNSHSFDSSTSFSTAQPSTFAASSTPLGIPSAHPFLGNCRKNVCFHVSDSASASA